MTGIDAGSSAKRIASLDGLRGVAASMVVIAHAVSALGKTPLQAIALHRSILCLFANGGGGVHVFFVLSGFCLAAPASRAFAGVTLSRFYIRRALRIHLPYLVGLIIAWWLSGGVYERTQDLETLSQSMIDLRRIHLSPGALGYAMRFPGEAFSQIPVGWTLRVEAIFSILIPGMIWLSLRRHWAIFVVLGIPALWIGATSDWDFLRFTIDFALGIAIYCERERLGNFFGQLAGSAQALLLAAGWLILSCPVYYMLDQKHPVLSLALYVTGSTILVAGAIHSRGLRSVLAAAPIAWIGRISYSVYLLHVPVIILLTPFVDHRLGLVEGGVFVVACLAGTYAISPVFYYLVEEPSIRLGRWLGGILGDRAGASTS